MSRAGRGVDATTMRATVAQMPPPWTQVRRQGWRQALQKSGRYREAAH
jgi:hypothetical protein